MKSKSPKQHRRAHIGRLAWPVFALIWLLFCSSCQGTKSEKIYGDGLPVSELRTKAIPLDQAFSSEDGTQLAVRGTIGKVCQKGCWFYLLGDKSMVYVDLSLKELTIPTSSTEKKAWVNGVLRGSGADRALEASMLLIAP